MESGSGTAADKFRVVKCRGRVGDIDCEGAALFKRREGTPRTLIKLRSYSSGVRASGELFGERGGVGVVYNCRR